MILSHYSPVHMLTVESRVHVRDPGRLPYKPNGFWISVDGDDDWLHWAKDNNFNIHNLAHRHVVTLKPDAKVRLITTDAELCAFIKEYGEVMPYPYTRRGVTLEGEIAKMDAWLAADCPWDACRVDLNPDWNRVMKDYDAMIIAPYLYRSRWPFIWYYTWDCASGCIWNTSIIESITHDDAWIAPVEEREENGEAA